MILGFRYLLLLRVLWQKGNWRWPLLMGSWVDGDGEEV